MAWRFHFPIRNYDFKELINDHYSDIKLYSNFHIEYKAIACIANEEEPPITWLSRHYQWLPRYGSSNGEFVHKANTIPVYKKSATLQQRTKIGALGHMARQSD